ncbi:hypothetical protein E1B28_003447 [Marasmius oreades]|uniref:Uncharacterized protein n=1 Tax=Marasmius oreades TaxID=181124 RepID=A0A9P7RLV4_9AGAR|nr:uncharacterized protein E1B28_003447 [Marasmius oreades]KAG7085914.1 hypothetical protein E1B28_003447 [Marasmius oreades]
MTAAPAKGLRNPSRRRRGSIRTPAVTGESPSTICIRCGRNMVAAREPQALHVGIRRIPEVGAGRKIGLTEGELARRPRGTRLFPQLEARGAVAASKRKLPIQSTLFWRTSRVVGPRSGSLSA